MDKSRKPVTLQKGVPAIKELLVSLGFQHATLKVTDSFTAITHEWRKSYITNSGRSGTKLLQWNTTDDQQDLEEMARSFVDSKNHGVRFWSPSRSWNQDFNIGFPRNKARIVELLKQLFYKQNLNAETYSNRKTKLREGIDEPDGSADLGDDNDQKMQIPLASPAVSTQAELDPIRVKIQSPGIILDARTPTKKPTSAAITPESRPKAFSPDIWRSLSSDSNEVPTPSVPSKRPLYRPTEGASPVRTSKRKHSPAAPLRRTRRAYTTRNIPEHLPKDEIDQYFDTVEVPEQNVTTSYPRTQTRDQFGKPSARRSSMRSGRNTNDILETPPTSTPVVDKDKALMAGETTAKKHGTENKPASQVSPKVSLPAEDLSLPDESAMNEAKGPQAHITNTLREIISSWGKTRSMQAILSVPSAETTSALSISVQAGKVTSLPDPSVRNGLQPQVPAKEVFDETSHPDLTHPVLNMESLSQDPILPPALSSRQERASSIFLDSREEGRPEFLTPPLTSLYRKEAPSPFQKSPSGIGLFPKDIDASIDIQKSPSIPLGTVPSFTESPVETLASSTSQRKLQIPLWIISYMPRYTEELWNSGKFQGSTLSDFMEGISDLTHKENIQAIKLTLRTPRSDTKITVLRYQEDSWNIAKDSFSQKLKESTSKDRISTRILIEPIYEGGVVSGFSGLSGERIEEDEEEFDF